MEHPVRDFHAELDVPQRKKPGRRANVYHLGLALVFRAPTLWISRGCAAKVSAIDENRFVQFRPLRGEDPGGAVADVHLKNLIACSHCSPVGGLSFRVANCRAAGISAAAAR
jgi:hypothetical protein